MMDKTKSPPSVVSDDQPGIGGLRFSEEPRKKKSKGKFLVVLFVLVAVCAAAWFLATNLGSVSLLGTQTQLVAQVESAGFTDINYYPADEALQTVESATAKYGDCQLTFKLTTRTVEDGSSIVSLAVVNDEGKFIYDATPAKLSADENFNSCNAG
ncbi:hypothetical protein KA043_02330 [Candidatus Saccharibacteria bacterium]|jgi:hypothetical protein|nr:hypothetical protein [Candidatus Saccharibacteria bacterium]